MPLGKNKLQNIAELLRTYKETGRIGNTIPKDLQHARRIASAIAESKVEKSPVKPRR